MSATRASMSQAPRRISSKRVGLEAELVLRPADDRVEPDLVVPLAVVAPVLHALVVELDPRRRVGPLRRHPALEQVRRLDEVVVDGDERVPPFAALRLGQERHLRRPPGGGRLRREEAGAGLQLVEADARARRRSPRVPSLGHAAMIADQARGPAVGRWGEPRTRQRLEHQRRWNVSSTPAASTTSARSKRSSRCFAQGRRDLWPGRRVAAMERQVAALFGKKAGVMVNSGSSALYLAVELLGLAPGSEVVTCGLTFSTDIAPLVRAGLVPVLVDCELDTFCVDVARIEEMITPRTGALLIPNLIGNAPDWDAIREPSPTATACRRSRTPATRSGRSCEAARPATAPTMSVTSFANSHIITCGGNGGMLLLDDDEARDRALMLRRWGRRSEVQFFGTKKRRAELLGRRRRHPLRQPVHLRRARLELRAVRDGRRLRPRAAQEARREPRPPAPDLRPPTPSSSPAIGTASCFRGKRRTFRPRGSATRSSSPRPRDSKGLTFSSFSTARGSTPAPSGPETCHASRCCAAAHSCLPADGLPNADAIMERGVLLPLSHAIDDETLDFVLTTLGEFLRTH